MEIVMAEDEIMNTVKELIANHHPDLVMVEDEIAVLMREKGSKTADGERVILGKSKKAPAIMSILGTKDWKFIIELAQDEWHSLNNKQRIALLDHHLCACRVDLDESTQGVKKCYIQQPDVVFYRDEVERHGFWRSGKTFTPPEPDLIADLFGDDTE
jgi:hypothetical protein